MKALSIQPPYAIWITLGVKTVEFRTWDTPYRGDLLICTSSSPKKGWSMPGYATCVVALDDVVPFKKCHLEAAMMDETEKGYAWLLSNPRLIKPFPVKGKLHIYDVDHKIEYVPNTLESLYKYYEPHTIRPQYVRYLESIGDEGGKETFRDFVKKNYKVK